MTNFFPPPYSRGDSTFAMIGSVRFATSLHGKKWFGLVRHQAPVVFPVVPEAARLYDSLITEDRVGASYCAVASQFLDEREGAQVLAAYCDNLRRALKQFTPIKNSATELAQWEIEVLVPDSAALEGTRSITHALYVDLAAVRRAAMRVGQPMTDERVAFLDTDQDATVATEPTPLFGEQCWLTREHIEIEFIDFDDETDYDEASDEYKTRRVLLNRAAFADALEITVRQIDEQIAKINAAIAS